MEFNRLARIVLFAVGVTPFVINGCATTTKKNAPSETSLAKQIPPQKSPPPCLPARADKIVFNSESFDFELQRVLGYATSGGSDINECLFTAKRITDGDESSWYSEWRALADRIHAVAQSCLLKKHLVSAREAFFRASNYYRTAEFYLHGNPHDPRILNTWRKSRDAFRKGAQLLERPVDIIKIPYEGTTLPGYFIRPDNNPKPRKTLLLQTGFDGTGEETYFEVGFFALKRDYNVLVFEGPGQGGALREQHLHFRPDWEKVVTPVVNFALTRPEVDKRRIALMGISMGGYMTPRAAAFEHRLAALVANTGIYDMSSLKKPWTSVAEREAAKKSLADNLDEANRGLRRGMSKSLSLRWSMNQGMYALGKKTPAEFALALYDYTLIGLAKKIRCPTLVVESEGDIFMKGQAQKLFQALACPKKYLRFTKTDLADAHCQMGAIALSNQRIFDWLDKILE